MTEMPEPNETDSMRHQWTAILCVGFLVCVLFSVVGRTYGPGGHVAPPQHDSLMYQQYARSMAEGHPFRYNPGDAPSTGSTSYLYPALLAVLYKVGAHGDALATAGFVLASVLYLAFLFLFWKACHLIAPDAAPLAAWLCVLSGHTALTALGQSDMGLFMMLSAGAVVAALSGRTVVCALALAAAAWSRPEGAILSALLVVVCLWRLWCGRAAAENTVAQAFLPAQSGQAEQAGQAGQAGPIGQAGKPAPLPYAPTASESTLQRPPHEASEFTFQRASGRNICRPWGLCCAGIAGVAAFAGVLALNYALTGTIAFQSILGKSPSLFYPPLEMAFRALRSLGDTTLEAGFGVSGDTDRRFLLLPVAGGALALWGLASRWRAYSVRGNRYALLAGTTGLVEAWWVASAAAALVLVAMSDWSGFFHDRYLGWIVPIGLLYAAIGARAAARRLAPVGIAGLLGGALLLYQAVGLVYYVVVYAQDSLQLVVKVDFARKVNDQLPPATVVGTGGWAGLAYYMPNLVTQNISGITSPEFAQRRHFITTLEVYRHHPELRCAAWLLPTGDARTSWFSDAIGGELMASTAALGEENALGLYAANWDLFDGATEPLSAAALEKVRGMRMVDRLDVGFAEDETRTQYATFTRVPGAFIHPMSKVAEVMPGQGAPTPTAAGETTSTRSILDVGRVIVGTETFRVKCRPGRPMRVVARVALQALGLSNFPRYGMRTQNFEFASPIRLWPIVNGQPVGAQTLDVAPGDSAEFFEMVFDVPGEMLKSDTATVTIGADHIAFGYWFYQAEE